MMTPMELEMKVLRNEDAERILDFEMGRLKESISDPESRNFAAWQAPWRQECLEYYLPLGWSFGVWSQEEGFQGYFLAQPLVYFDGLTQNLWVEHLAAQNEDVAGTLVEIAYRWSRDKHLQRLVFRQGEELNKTLKKWNGSKWPGHVAVVPTSKIKNP